MKYLIDLPDVIKDADGNEYESTGEFRRTTGPDEWLLNINGVAERWSLARPSDGRYIILRRKWTWPTSLKGWGIAKDEGGDIYVYSAPAEMDDGIWFSTNEVFLEWIEEILGPPPTITDWTQPILNPNYKE